MMKTGPKLKKMAQKEARNKIKKKIIKKRDWNSLSVSERERVEKQLAKKKSKLIAKIVKKILPQMRKKETETYQGLSVGPMNHIHIKKNMVQEKRVHPNS